MASRLLEEGISGRLAQHTGSDLTLRERRLKAGWLGGADTLHGQGQDGGRQGRSQGPSGSVCVSVCMCARKAESVGAVGMCQKRETEICLCVFIQLVCEAKSVL